MRFGIQTGPQNVTWPELLDIWQLVDGLKFDTAWTFDHFFPIFTDLKGPQLEGWTTLTALAMKTQHVRVGTLVTGITYREPAVLAKIGATLDVITGGRLEMGIGAGWFELEHQALGIPFYTTAERIKRLGEACEVILRMWTEEAANFDGAYYHPKEAYCNHKPSQEPPPPLMIEASGENLAPKMVQRNFDPGFFVDHFEKDLGIALDECQRMGLAMPGLGLVRQFYIALKSQGHGRKGYHALLLVLEQLSAIQR